MYDVAIVGAGPGGSTAGYVLAREGFRVVILERERFPRFHIGESLLPRTMGLYRRLNLSSVLEKEGFIAKYGAQFVSNDGSVQLDFDFFTGRPDPDRVAYEVEREVFDTLLLEHARKQGAEVREGSNVLGVESGNGDLYRLKIRGDQGGESDLEARWVIDASGQSSLLAKAHDFRVKHPKLQKVAIFTRYTGMTRREGRKWGNVDLVLGKGGWFWLIPLRNDVSSVGFVADTAEWKRSGLSPEGFLDQAVENSPYVRSRLQTARRSFEVLTAGNYSYSSKRLSGPGFVLVGDAAGFLDPIFSTGVMLAMRGGEMAALALAKGLKSGRPLNVSLFDRYERTFRRWMQIHFRMIEAYYSPGFAEVLLNPKNTLGVVDAVTALLAGQSNLGPLDRLRIQFFYFLIRLNNRWGFLKDPRPPEHAVPHG